MHYIQVMSSSCSRWRRYLSDDNTNADVDCDDDDGDCLYGNTYHANHARSTVDQFRQPEAAPKYMRLVFFFVAPSTTSSYLLLAAAMSVIIDCSITLFLLHRFWPKQHYNQLCGSLSYSLNMFIISADDVARWRRYCDEFVVTVHVGGCLRLARYNKKPLIRMTWNLVQQ